MKNGKFIKKDSNLFKEENLKNNMSPLAEANLIKISPSINFNFLNSLEVEKNGFFNKSKVPPHMSY